jgi:hypothetical protein
MMVAPSRISPVALSVTVPVMVPCANAHEAASVPKMAKKKALMKAGFVSRRFKPRRGGFRSRF